MIWETNGNTAFGFPTGTVLVEMSMSSSSPFRNSCSWWRRSIWKYHEYLNKKQIYRDAFNEASSTLNTTKNNHHNVVIYCFWIFRCFVRSQLVQNTHWTMTKTVSYVKWNKRSLLEELKLCEPFLLTKKVIVVTLSGTNCQWGVEFKPPKLRRTETVRISISVKALKILLLESDEAIVTDLAH